MLADILFEKLLNRIAEYNPSFDKGLITKAYQYAKRAHEWQIRKSWEPYIIHPLYTAMNLTRIHADDISLTAWLLHDVPEDTIYNIDNIRNEFGNDVAEIVDWVTKMSKVYYKFDMREREVDSLRKLFVSIWKDLRVILVKICDRLHNLQTLQFVREDKRLRVAKETLEIYVPIINLLSIWEFMWEMDDLCFKFIYPEEYKKLYDNFGKKYDYYRKKIDSIKEKLLSIAKMYDMEITVQWRIKSLYSIYNKIKSKNVSLDMIYDVVAMRVISPTIQDCYTILGVIHSNFKVKVERFKDYISSPKNNWYQSIHTTVFDFDWDMVEFQLLTDEMNRLNKFGLASHYIYKNYNFDYTKVPDWIKDILEIQRNNTNSEYFFDKVKTEILSENIHCFTPKWKLIEIPEWSTVLDFAYKVHTELWNKFIWAYINWNYVSDPMHIIKRWDVVNIVKWNETNNDFVIEYISIVKTNLARENLRKIFKHQSRDKRIKLWKFILNKKLEIFWLRHFNDLPIKVKEEIYKKYKVKNSERFYDMIWTWSIDADSIIKNLSSIYKNKDEVKSVSLDIYPKVEDFTLIWSIISLFKTLNIKIKSIDYKWDCIHITFFVKTFGEFQNLFLELKRIPNIREIKRLFPFRLIIFNILLMIFMLIVAINPFILAYLLDVWFVEKNIMLTNWMFIFTFLFMFWLVYFFKNIVKVTLPDLFNQKIFWIYMSILNTIVLLTIFWEMVFLKNYINLFMFLWLTIITYWILAFEYITNKIEQWN